MKKRMWLLPVVVLSALVLFAGWQLVDSPEEARSTARAAPPPPFDLDEVKTARSINDGITRDRLEPTTKLASAAKVSPIDAAASVANQLGLQGDAVKGATRYSIAFGVYQGAAQSQNGKLIYLVTGDNQTRCLDLGPGNPEPSQCYWYAKVDADSGEVLEFVWTPKPVLK